MPTPSLLRPYVIKKVIVELRHSPDLLRTERARSILNEMVENFDVVKITGVEGGQQSVQLVDNKAYRTLIVEWNRVGMTAENLRDIEEAKTMLKKMFVPVTSELRLKNLLRFGVRVMFFFPFEGSFEALKTFYSSRFVKNPNDFECLGQVHDYGLSSMTIEDGQRKINLVLGPFSKTEIRDKISEFKSYEESFESALLLDLDLYQDEKTQYKIGLYLADTLDSARLKALSFYEQLTREPA